MNQYINEGQLTPNTFPNLESWLHHLENAHPVGIDMGLHRINEVKQKLAIHFSCPVITVGGTNGKGSTCAFLESIFNTAGYRVGCHTSPHLHRFNERAKINGEEVEDSILLENFSAVEVARCSLPKPVSLTYFEFTTLAILNLFAKSQLDIVILEVGLGGRLDAVNIIDADCSIITSIDIDHVDYLGDTREKIAFEKAGIFRPGKPAICADPLAPNSLIKYANDIGSKLYLQGKDFNFQGDQQQWAWAGLDKRISGLGYPALRGANQLLNASAVLAALTALKNIVPVGVQDIRTGFALVDLPARFQVLPGKPTVVLDVAHNPHACSALAQSIDKMGYFPFTHAIFGVMSDKDIVNIIRPLLGLIDYWHCVDLPIERAAKAKSLELALENQGVKNSIDSGISVSSSPKDAYSETLESITENDRIVVFGSFLTVAGVMASLGSTRITQAH